MIVLISGCDATKDFAASNFAWSDDKHFTGFAECARFGVQTQLSFARIFVGAVTGVAFVGKNGTNIAIELDDFGRLLNCGKSPYRKEKSNRDNLFHEQNLTEDATNKFAREVGCKIEILVKNQSSFVYSL